MDDFCAKIFIGEKLRTEDVLLSLPRPIAIVGNGHPGRKMGSVIDRYSSVIRINNYIIEGFEALVGRKTTLRCTSGWEDIEVRHEYIEISPFRLDSVELSSIEKYISRGGQSIITPEADIHLLLPEIPKPSTGFALAVLASALGIEVSLFGFDGFLSGHYWAPGAPLTTTHSNEERDILLKLPHVIFYGISNNYPENYDYCRSSHSEYNINIGLKIYQELGINPVGEKILAFGADNGKLALYMEKQGNMVTPFEVSHVVFDHAAISQKISGDSLTFAQLEGFYDRFVSIDVLELLSENDIRIVVREAARLAQSFLVSVSTRPRCLLGPQGENLHLTVHTVEWWRDLFSHYFKEEFIKVEGVGRIVMAGTRYSTDEARLGDSPLPDDNFELPQGYLARDKAEYYIDSDEARGGVIWQPDVYEAAAELARSLGCKTLIDIGCGQGQKLASFYPEFDIIGIDYKANIEWCRKEYSFGIWLESDLEKVKLLPLPDNVLKHSIIICSDVIEHLSDPRNLLMALRQLTTIASALVLSTPDRIKTWGVDHLGPPPNPAHTREWSLDELKKLVERERFPLKTITHTRSNNQTNELATILAIFSNSNILPDILHFESNRKHPIPSVSVIVPTHNRPEMLKFAIQSILDQTFQDFEIIVVNDAGQDVSAVVAAFNSPKITYLAHESNKGLAAARNTGIRSAKGKYVAYLDDDDIFYPDHLETLVNFLEVHTEYKIAYTDAYRAHQELSHGKLITTHRDIPYSFDFDYDRILKENYIPVLCVMHHKDCFDEVEPFDEYLRRTEDWDLWLRMSRHFPFAHIKKISCEFSVRKDPAGMMQGMEEPFYWAALHMGHKYRRYTQNKPDISAWQNAWVSNALVSLIQSLSNNIVTGAIDVATLLCVASIDQALQEAIFLMSCYPEETANFEKLILALSVYAKRAKLSELDKLSCDRQRSAVNPISCNHRLIAFYLPQFHPIPENDEWWGKGFTEWTNVAKARPLFEGHYQPHIPADLGFYDLRLGLAREAQADLARQYGIEGFCYWHYWFSGQRLLERPFNEVLESGSPDFPFCLAWANETWSRRWLGEEKDILVSQTYSDDDDLRHIQWLIKAFRDPRYIRVNNRPLFLIYRPKDLPDPVKLTLLFRTKCLEQGLPEPYLVGINGHSWDLDCRTLGFDATLMFMPQLGNLPDVMNDRPSDARYERNQQFGVNSRKTKIYDYAEALESMLSNRTKYSHSVIPSIFAGWDNTARRGENAIVITNTSPDVYRRALSRLVQEQQQLPAEERLIFINAWNEWAEGNHLEPDLKNGHAFLSATLEALGGVPNNPGQTAAVTSDSADNFYYHAGDLGKALPLYLDMVDRRTAGVDDFLSLVSIFAYMGNKESATQLLDHVKIMEPDTVWAGWYQQVINDPAWFHNQLARLRDIMSSQQNLTYEIFAQFDDNFWFWINSMGRRKYPDLYSMLAGLPDPELQLRWTGSAGDRSLDHGFKQYSVFKSLAEKHGMHTSKIRRLLDYGCGYGRMLRFFVKDCPQAQLCGADIFDSLNIWCRDNFKNGHFYKPDIWPPTSYEDDMFDLIYSFSVFSHLSEDNGIAWLQELNRITAPGGLMIVTIWSHPDRTRDYHAQYFTDYDALIRDYESGKFCYSTLGYSDDAVYAEALIPPSYITSVWSKYVDVLDIIEGHPFCQNQSYVVMRKKVRAGENAPDESHASSKPTTEHDLADTGKADYFYYHAGDLAKALPLYLDMVDGRTAGVDDFLSLVSISAYMGNKEIATQLLDHVKTIDPDTVWTDWYQQVINDPAWFLNQLAILRNMASSQQMLTYESFAQFDDNFWFWINSIGLRKYPGLHSVLAGLPDAKWQTNLTGCAGDRSLLHGFNQYILFKSLAEKHGMHTSKIRRLLDYGCGYGRMLRFFVKDCSNALLCGADLFENLLELCRNNFKKGHFYKPDIWPPTSYNADMFDLVYSFSVFSHLSEENGIAWLQELNRITAPDGLIIVTIWSHPSRTRDYHLKYFPDYADLISTYESGKFCYSTIGYGDDAVYAEALIPPSYITSVWSNYVDVLDIIEGNPLSSNQSYVVMRKKKVSVSDDKEVLSNTSRPLKVACIFLPPWDPGFPSYSIAIFKALTKKAGHEFFDFDLNIDLYKASFAEDKKLWAAQFANLWDADQDKIILKYSEFLNSYIDHIIEKKINLYALSVMCNYSLELARYVAERIKKQDPEALIILGGSPCFPNSRGLNIFNNKYIDAICTGEADFVWTKILAHIEKNNNLHIDINGICYKDNDGNIVDNGIPDVIGDLNSIPFADYSDIDFSKYGNKYMFSIMTSRGCINSCAFCGDRILYPKYRFRSAESIFNEITKHLNDFNNNHSVPSDINIIPYISFNDLLINGVIKEFELFCDLVINSGLKFRWGGMALIRKEMSAELLAKMKRAGCDMLNWGLESGCQEVLDLMQKKFCNIDLATQVIKRTHEAGITQTISLIAGFPGETDEMFLKTKEFITENKDYVSVGIQPMMLVPNTAVYNNLEDFSIAAGAHWLTWQTIDGTNTYEVRQKRVAEISSILEGKLMTIDK